ncbi:hypothetical protein [Methylobacterium dankookense]|uniref:Uncharacterized protein n=1 Tax=Methylobacterium dankookense TaxID=560405 RepID=A0A564G7Y3_9HYPH|nr:hypothetical protein [Methylobacterium dankookense]GJD58344.1 hypothetical protein IFDJLNFL_4263 [Methylobacterium dankookense]VUF15651.1 hypothetical protein MTDSW087_05395 [Methylobacterium dankookense]
MRRHYPLNSAGVEDAGKLPWTNGVPSTGTEGSYPGFEIVVDTESELLNAQDASGLVRNGADQTQLAQAISRGAYLGAFGGSANALTASLQNSTVWPSLLPGMKFTGIVTQPNTGAVSVALSGFSTPPGVLNLFRRDGQALQAGDLRTGLPFSFVYDGSAFRVSTPAASEVTVAGASLVHRGVSTGTTNAIVAGLTPGITAYELGVVYVIKLSAANTGAVTANLDGRGALPVVRSNGNPLRAGDISNMAVLTYNSDGYFVLANLAQEIAPPGSGFAGSQQRFGYTPVNGQTQTLTATFTTTYAGIVQCVATLNTSPQNGNISTAASISVNGAASSGSADSVSGSCTSIVSVAVPAGASVTVAAQSTPSQTPTAAASQYLNYIFIPG